MQQKKRRRYIIIGSILLLLIIARLLLPYFVLKYANRSLAEMKGYYGHVHDIDISLYRSAYQLDSIYINKVDSASGQQVDFFSARKIDLAIEWQPLLHGSVVGNIGFLYPRLVFTKDKAELGEVAKDTNDFRKILKDLMPLKVNRFEIQHGSIHYVDSTAIPKVDVSLDDVYVLAQNLKNTTDSRELLPSTVVATAGVYGGTLEMNMKLDALADDPTFDMMADMKGANLASLNDFFKVYGKFDVSHGTMGLYTEFAAKEGRFTGYVKPIAKDLKIRGPEDEHDKFLQKVKESALNIVGKAVTNPGKKQLGTKVPIEGRFDDPSINNWEAIWELLRNAFIEALMPAVDNEINIGSVDEAKEERPGFFRRLFGGKKKEKEEKADKQEEGLERYKTNR
ncbi:DUF748 domain-containing protein [Nemorincola caseinilytica]|uniref:DUF748 domain-containing protein n=1 Tax=Nemorincola caseinilytica TaxID=2054315 RepID=A0ABP8NQF2_9BACT